MLTLSENRRILAADWSHGGSGMKGGSCVYWGVGQSTTVQNPPSPTPLCLLPRATRADRFTQSSSRLRKKRYKSQARNKELPINRESDKNQVEDCLNLKVTEGTIFCSESNKCDQENSNLFYKLQGFTKCLHFLRTKTFGCGKEPKRIFSWQAGSQLKRRTSRTGQVSKLPRI